MTDPKTALCRATNAHPNGQYISTYCRHATDPGLDEGERDRLHRRCREQCKICGSPCACGHHKENPDD